MEFVRLHLGLVLVIVGVAGEGVEIIWKLLVRKRSERLDLALDSIGAFFWIVLVIGLALEIPDAARTDKDAAELNRQSQEFRLKADALEQQIMDTSNNVVKNDPRNADISELSAHVVFFVKEENARELTNREYSSWGNNASSDVGELVLLKNKNDAGSGFPILEADDFKINFHKNLFDRVNRKYDLDFKLPDQIALHFVEHKVKQLDEERYAKLLLTFIPNGTEIEGGGIDLKANNIDMFFNIIPKTDTNSSKDVHFFMFEIMATNNSPMTEN